MSDFSTTPDGGAPAGVPTPPPMPEQDYQALWQQEKQERIAEREKYKSIAQVMDRLDPDSRQSILSVAQAAAQGDVDAIAEWSAATYRNLRGSDIAAEIAARQNGQPSPQQFAPQPQQEQQPQYLTAEQAAAIAAEQAQKVVQTQQLAQQIAGKLETAGYPSQSAAGRTIIDYARNTGLPIEDAIQWYDNEMMTLWQQRAAAGQQAAGSLPPTAPSGAPATNTLPTNLTPKERAVARLQQSRQQPGA